MSKPAATHTEPHHLPDEYLETLYHLRERHQLDLATLTEHLGQVDPQVLRLLVDRGKIVLQGEQIELTADGFHQAKQIVRRHRLAERLLTDVLHMNPAEVERSACEFEHMVAEEITESICILLGHPRRCPHGSPIPKGPCCEAAARACEAAVVPLTEVPLGSAARIAYVNGASDERHHRLTHFGVVPGATIKLHQLRPAVVVMLDNARLAMEPCIAREIFVWKKSPPAGRADGSRPTEGPKKCYDELQGTAAPTTRGRRLLRFWRR